VALIFLYKSCEFGKKICNNSRDTEFFLRDHYFLARPVLLCKFQLNVAPLPVSALHLYSYWCLFAIFVSDKKFCLAPFTIHFECCSFR